MIRSLIVALALVGTAFAADAAPAPAKQDDATIVACAKCAELSKACADCTALKGTCPKCLAREKECEACKKATADAAAKKDEKKDAAAAPAAPAPAAK